MSIINDNILADDVMIFPSANALDGGQMNSEGNLAILSDKFYSNSFVVKKADELDGLSISGSGTVLTIKKGRCYIEGKSIILHNDLTIDLNDASMVDYQNRKIFNNIGTTYNVYLSMHEDTSGCVMGDRTADDNITNICGGLTVTLATSGESVVHPLLLGTVKALTASTMEVTDDPSKYCIIDISQVSGGDGEDLDTKIANAIAAALNNQAYITILKDTGKDQKSPILYLIEKSGDNTVNESWIRNTGSATEVYFKDHTTNKEASISINKDGVVYNGEAANYWTGNTVNIISKLIELEQAINSGGVPVATANGTTTAVDSTSTSNGNSNELARANHAHTQYIKGTRNGDGSQTVTTKLNVNSSLSVTGNITANGTITGSRVYNAVWNDYADALLKIDGIDTEPGDIIAKDLYSDGYTLANSFNPRLVVGVHSDTYGHLLGGTEKTLDKYIPVAVAGNVKVKVVGKVKMGDFIVASFIDGVGVASYGYVPGTIVGKALENKETNEVERILMQVMLI